MSPWDSWAAALLRKALQAAPLDFAGLWGVAVRFGLNGLALGGGDPQPLCSLLDLISEPTAAGTCLPSRSELGCLSLSGSMTKLWDGSALVGCPSTHR